jgi:hypothetical protein
MIPVETVPGVGGVQESSRGVNPSMIYLIHFKNLCKCHNVPPSSTTIEGGGEEANSSYMLHTNTKTHNY